MPLDTSREPCPDRILDDMGSAYAMGAVGGAVYHFVRGVYHSPNGHRLAGGATAARMNALRLAGGFGVWGGLFSTVDCGLVYARNKEDPWNSIVAGAATGGILSMRRGVLASGRSALFCGVLLTLIEGTGIVLDRLPTNAPPDEDLPQDAVQTAPGFLGMPPAPPILVEELQVPPESGPSGWFSSFFGKKNANGDRKPPEMLELDLPTTDVPSSFDYK